jgi:hypothetical protein
MTTPRDPDLTLAAWLDDGPARLPATTRRVILASIRTSRQERRPRWVPWRTSMLTFKWAAAAIAAVMVGYVGFNLVGVSPSPGFSPSPGSSPAASSSPGPIDTSSWTTYVSDRYGFSIGHPADWVELPAEDTWTMAEAPDVPFVETFGAPGDDTVGVSAWSVAVEPDTTAEAWIATYCPLTTSPCTGIEERTEPVTMDGHPGTLVRFIYNTQAFVLVGDRMYVVAAWRPESDATVVPYGGASRLVKSFLSTMRLLPGGPGLDTSSWSTYVSDRYGFSIGHPADWGEQPAMDTWIVAESLDPASMETFGAPGEGPLSV